MHSELYEYSFLNFSWERILGEQSADSLGRKRISRRWLLTDFRKATLPLCSRLPHDLSSCLCSMFRPLSTLIHKSHTIQRCKGRAESSGEKLGNQLLRSSRPSPPNDLWAGVRGSLQVTESSPGATHLSAALVVISRLCSAELARRTGKSVSGKLQVECWKVGKRLENAGWLFRQVTVFRYLCLYFREFFWVMR